MTARKLYVGIDAGTILPALVIADLWDRSGLNKDNCSANPLHITVQYCGKGIDDDTAEAIAHIWTQKLNKLHSDDAHLVIDGPKFDFYGKDHDQLVVLCGMSNAFRALVAEARAEVLESVPEVPKADFDFSPHMSFGTAKKEAESTGLSDIYYSARFDTVTLWGAKGEVRGTIKVPFVA